ncbi:amidohydrolase family protein [Paenibacillaceae bacterium WGS1546]|uniref:amidohydrolase family protein n=1 Tax=Cohnella sp. WGS1546 TaxID=3366810 RepID=UPI00372D1A1F
MIVDVHTHSPNFFMAVDDDEVGVTDVNQSMRPGSDGVKLIFSEEEHIKGTEGADKVIAFNMAIGGNPNDTTSAYAKKYPDRVIGFMGLDPKQANVLDELDRSYYDLGLKGIKLGPIYQKFHPLDKRAYAIYARAEQLGLPILFHQGATYPRQAPLKYANPILLEDVALDFPNLKMIIAHMGHPWIAETIVLIRKQPNVFADISGLFYRPWQYYQAMSLCHEYGRLDKLLFGSDYPIATTAETLEGLRNVNGIIEGTKLPRIPEEEIEKLIHRDTLGLLGLS